MRVVGVIAEYDPFHRGHARQLAAFTLRRDLTKLRKRYPQGFSAARSMRRT